MPVKRNSPYRFLVSVKDTDCFGERYLILNARLSALSPDVPPSFFPHEIFNPSSWTLGEWACERFDNLQVTAQRNRETDHHDFYGWSVTFDHMGSVSESQAESMYRVLRAVNRYVTSLDDRFGAVQTAGQYLARVSDYFTGATCPFVRRTSDAGYVLMTAGDMQSWLSREVRNWDERWSNLS